MPVKRISGYSPDLGWLSNCSNSLACHISNTVYQISTTTALVECVSQGAVRVAKLREHGDLGLGTFEDLDGEMVILNGKFYQVRRDGFVREVGDDVLTSFAVITRFAPEAAGTLDECPDMGQLTSCFD